MTPLTLILLVLVIGGLALIPTRRLFTAGFSRTILTTYFLFMLATGLVTVELRAASRFLVPIIVVAYIAPFVAASDSVTRFRARIRGGGSTPGGSTRGSSTWAGGRRTGDPRRPPMKNVTPPEERPADERQAG